MRMNEKVFNSWLWPLAFAAALKLCLMPLTFHADILFIHHFPWLFWAEGVKDIYGTWGGVLMERFGTAYYPPLVFYSIAAAQWLPLNFDPVFAEIMGAYHASFLSADSINIVAFMQQFSLEKRLAFSFWGKWVYFACDLLSVLAIAKMFDSDKKIRSSAMAGWFCHPVVIFSAFIIGQYRSISSLFVFLMLFALRKGRAGVGFFLLGIAALMENYPWLLLPPLFLLFVKRGRITLYYVLAFSLPLLTVLVPLFLTSEGMVLYSYASPLILKTAMGSVVRSGGALASGLGKMILLGSYLLLLLSLWRIPKNRIESGREWEIAADSAIFILLLLYATSSTSIHYFMWVLPFWVCRNSTFVPWPPVLSHLLIALLFFFNMDSRALNLGLFLPLSPEYWMSLPSLHEIMANFLPWGKLIAAGRLLFSLLCIYMAVRLFNFSIKPLTGQPKEGLQ